MPPAEAGEPRLSYALEDELHAEVVAESADREVVLAEAYRRAALPWDGLENRAPCRNWRRCGRHLELVTYDEAQPFPERELSRELVVRIESSGVHWSAGYEPPTS